MRRKLLTRIDQNETINMTFAMNAILKREAKERMNWLQTLHPRVANRPELKHKSVRRLENLASVDGMAKQQFNAMVAQLDASAKKYIPTLPCLLLMMDYILETTPDFIRSGYVGSPINALLDLPLTTPAGQMAYQNNNINQELKNVILEWEAMAKAADETQTMSKSQATICRQALYSMDTPQYQPDTAVWGIRLWSAFFTRDQPLSDHGRVG